MRTPRRRREGGGRGREEGGGGREGEEGREIGEEEGEEEGEEKGEEEGEEEGKKGEEGERGRKGGREVVRIIQQTPHLHPYRYSQGCGLELITPLRKVCRLPPRVVQGRAIANQSWNRVYM